MCTNLVAAMGFFECRHWFFFVVTALVFLWVVASGLAELSAQAPVVVSEKKSGAAQKNGKQVDSPWPNAWQTAISRGARIRERSPSRDDILGSVIEIEGAGSGSSSGSILSCCDCSLDTSCASCLHAILVGDS